MTETLSGGACQQPQLAASDVRHRRTETYTIQ